MSFNVFWGPRVMLFSNFMLLKPEIRSWRHILRPAITGSRYNKNGFFIAAQQSNTGDINTERYAVIKKKKNYFFWRNWTKIKLSFFRTKVIKTSTFTQRRVTGRFTVNKSIRHVFSVYFALFGMLYHKY